VPPAPTDRPKRRFHRRHFHILAGVVGVVLVVGAAVYVERGPLGARIARSYLRGRGVPAIIQVERLDTGGFTGRVILGDPNDPDLTIQRVEVEFEPTPLLKGGLLAPRIRFMRLVEPRLKARWDGKRLTFGSLQRLVDDLSRTPGAGPGPTVVVERGFGRLATPAGELRLTGDGRLDSGRFTRLSLRLQPALLRQGALTAQLDGATLQASSRSGLIVATLHLDARRVARADASVEGLHADVAAQVPYGRALRLDGRFSLDAALRAAALSSGPGKLADPRLTLALAGISSGPVDRLGLRGSGTGALTASAWSTPGVSAERLDLAGRFVGLDLARVAGTTRFSMGADVGGAVARIAASGMAAGPARLRAQFAGVQGTVDPAGGNIAFVPDLTFAAPRASAAGLSTRDTSAELTSSRLVLDWRKGGWSLSGPLRARAAAASLVVQPILAGDLALRSFSLDLAGQAAVGSAPSRLDLAGSARSQGGALSAAAARAIADALPLVGADPVGRAAILDGFRNVRLDAPAFALHSGADGPRFALPRPLQLIGAGGARASLGALAGRPLAVASGSGFRGGLVARASGAGLPDLEVEFPAYTAGQDHGGLTLRAESRLSASFSGETLHDLKLQAPARLVRAGGVLSATLEDCAPVILAAFGRTAEPLLTDVRVRACPDGATPALTLGLRAWRFRTALQAFSADAPAGEVHIGDGRGVLDLTGAGREPTGFVEIASAGVVDAAPMKRFEPLALAGRLDLARDVWTGPVRVATAAKGRPLATLQVAHVMATATGSADIAAPALRFAKDGLQPGEISPVAGALASDAEGVVSFAGRAEWSPGGGVTSRGRLTTAGVDFRSQFGLVRRATADLTFTSLAPLTTEPGQAVAADEIAWLVPLQHASARIAVKADRIDVEAAKAEAANGEISLEPLDLPYAPNSEMNGVVRLAGIDLGALIERFNLSDKLSLDAHIDGVVPFAFAKGALKLDKGHVFATGPGRLSLKREALTGAVASAPGAPPAVGGIQDIAYQALENLAFDKLEADIASQPMGRLGILFKINGRNDPPNGGETRIGLFDLLRGRAFQGPIALPKGTPVNLTLDTSLNFDELLAAYNERGRSEPVQPAPAKD
jgi:hypothetical protein